MVTLAFVKLGSFHLRVRDPCLICELAIVLTQLVQNLCLPFSGHLIVVDVTSSTLHVQVCLILVLFCEWWRPVLAQARTSFFFC
jgi:hypothetical protein